MNFKNVERYAAMTDTELEKLQDVMWSDRSRARAESNRELELKLDRELDELQEGWARKEQRHFERYQPIVSWWAS